MHTNYYKLENIHSKYINTKVMISLTDILQIYQSYLLLKLSASSCLQTHEQMFQIQNKQLLKLNIIYKLYELMD